MIDKKTREEIVGLIRNKELTIEEASQKYEVGTASIYRWLKSNDTDNTKDAIKRLYEEGHDIEEISKMYKVSPETVSGIVGGTSPMMNHLKDVVEENKRLKEEIEELKELNLALQKTISILIKEK